jgi:hypothetical protein
MQYEARRRMNLSGVEYAPGELIPQEVVTSIDPGRLASLIRVGHFRMRPAVTETETAVAFGEPPVAESGDEDALCPQCGKGPYKRLAQHISKAHPE